MAPFASIETKARWLTASPQARARVSPQTIDSIERYRLPGERRRY